MVAWMGSMAKALANEAEPLPVPLERRVQFIAMHEAFAEAYRVANEPATRTVGTVARKNDCRRAIERESRALSRTLRGAESMSDAQLAALGLNVPKKAARHIGPPAEGPMVKVLRVENASVFIQLCDAERSGTRARPDNAVRAILFYATGRDAARPPEQWQYLMQTNATTLCLPFGGQFPAGTRVHLCARWLSRRNEPSPASMPVSAVLGDGITLEGQTARLKPWAA